MNGEIDLISGPCGSGKFGYEDQAETFAALKRPVPVGSAKLTNPLNYGKIKQ